MAWLQQRPQVSDPALFYTVGMNKTVLIVGLGNVGKAYDLTRHNIGFYAVDDFVSRNSEMDPWIEKKDLQTFISTGRIGETRVLVIKPTTLMNRSGDALQAVSHFYKISAEKIVVVHDDVDITFGQLRMRMGGSSAGHNGIKSISEQLGEHYGRIRVGIGPKKPLKIDSADFVLQKFSAVEQKQLPNLAQEVSAVLSEYIFGNQELPNETRSFLI